MADWLSRLWQSVDMLLAPAALVAFLGALSALVARSTAKSYVEGRIQHGFAKDLEALKADLRRNEEEFKSRLRVGEAEINALQSALLSGRSNRLGLLDKRRIEAVESIWLAVGSLAPLKNSASMISLVKLSKAAESSANDPKMGEFMETLLPKESIGNDLLLTRPVKDQPFVSDLSWAYYEAYVAICAYYFTYVKLITLGMSEASKVVDDNSLKNIVKAALPHAAAQIDKWDADNFYHLLKPLEERLLAELKRSLEDPSVDEERVRQAKAILAAVAERESRQLPI